MDVPVLDTARLRVREFEPGDLEAAHRLFDVDLGPDGALSRDERRDWLTWTVLGYRQLAQLHQPPYGDRAIELKETGELVGSCGYTPFLGPLGQIPSLRGGGPERPGLASAEVGIYYALAPARRGRGYETEAARALV